MNARTRLAALVLAGSLAALAACGDDTTESAATESIPPASPASSTTDGTAPGTAAADTDCAVERRTLETAVEAFNAENGAFPDSDADLVAAQLLLSEPEAYDVAPGTGEVVRVPGVACQPGDGPLEDIAPDAVPEQLTVDQVLAEIGPGGIELFGGEACAREFAEIAVAAELFIAREGREPERLADLTDDLAVDIVLWDFDEALQELVPAPGSPCVDFAEQEASQICEAERQTLEVATEAYTAQFGNPPSSEDDLVPEYLREPIERFDLDADGSVVPAVGGPCDTVP